jgi:hypothetical protein
VTPIIGVELTLRVIWCLLRRIQVSRYIVDNVPNVETGSVRLKDIEFVLNVMEVIKIGIVAGGRILPRYLYGIYHNRTQDTEGQDAVYDEETNTTIVYNPETGQKEVYYSTYDVLVSPAVPGMAGLMPSAYAYFDDESYARMLALSDYRNPEYNDDAKSRDSVPRDYVPKSEEDEESYSEQQWKTIRGSYTSYMDNLGFIVPQFTEPDYRLSRDHLYMRGYLPKIYDTYMVLDVREWLNTAQDKIKDIASLIPFGIGGIAEYLFDSAAGVVLYPKNLSAAFGRNNDFPLCFRPQSFAEACLYSYWISQGLLSGGGSWMKFLWWQFPEPDITNWLKSQGRKFGYATSRYVDNPTIGGLIDGKRIWEYHNPAGKTGYHISYKFDNSVFDSLLKKKNGPFSHLVNRDLAIDSIKLDYLHKFFRGRPIYG